MNEEGSEACNFEKPKRGPFWREHPRTQIKQNQVMGLADPLLLIIIIIIIILGVGLAN